MAKTHKKADGNKERKEVTLSDDQKLAALFLARAGYKYKSKRRTGAVLAASKEIKVHENTISNWIKIPEFIQEIESYESKLANKAFEGLERLLQGDALNQPSATAIIWQLKNSFPSKYDDQLRRDLVRYKKQAELLEKENENLKEAIYNLPDVTYFEHTRESAEEETKH